MKINRDEEVVAERRLAFMSDFLISSPAEFEIVLNGSRSFHFLLKMICGSSTLLDRTRSARGPRLKLCAEEEGFLIALVKTF